MKVGVLTSSRADFGIYWPLLQKLKTDDFFDLEIIAFGTHLSKFHGFTLREIESAGFSKIRTINTVLANDDENAIASSFALTCMKFADFWQINGYDVVFCLGDRYEMAAAVQAGIPYGLKFAHFHGGETTLGAIDNIYRHQITLASSLHFTATTIYSKKVAQLTGAPDNIFMVGSLSLDGLRPMRYLTKKAFKEQFDIQNDYLLVTFHPETVSTERNQKYAEEMIKALQGVLRKIGLVITMPNMDTKSSIYRERLVNLAEEYPEQVRLIENFGKLNYFSAMKYSRGLLGNTSSGIIEAASFGKYVVNVGNRQQGRARSKNVIDCDFTSSAIRKATNVVLSKSGDFIGENVYYQANVAENVSKILKSITS